MLSNHNQNLSSFRIIEPRHNSQPPQQQYMSSGGGSGHQLPILNLSGSKTSSPTENYSSNSHHVFRNSPPNMMYHQYSQQPQPVQLQRTRNLSDTDSSYIPETTSESGISDLDMSEKCTCCPYGYHIDVDFVTFLQTLGGKNLNKQLKKIQRKRNERLQRSMEYVIDEVEKLRQITAPELEMASESPVGGGSPLFYQNAGLSGSASKLVIPSTLKRTISKIDQQMYEDNEIFNRSNEDMARKLLLLEHSRSVALRNRSGSSAAGHHHHAASSHVHHSSSLPPPQNRNTIQLQNMNLRGAGPRSARPPPCYHHAPPPPPPPPCLSAQPPRRSYSSCGEPVTRCYVCHSSVSGAGGRSSFDAIATNAASTQRRCYSTSRAVHPVAICTSYVNESAPKQQQQTSSVYKEVRRSRSVNRRTKSRSPVQTVYQREIRINLAKPEESEHEEEEHHLLNCDQMEETRTVTTHVKPPPPAPVPHRPLLNLCPPPVPVQDVQEEVLLNLFSCNNSASLSSESSESLAEYEEEDHKLKINEIYEAKQETKVIEIKQRACVNKEEVALRQKLVELEKKLQRMSELEMKNNLLNEEKQMLMRQLLAVKQCPEPAPPPPPPKPEPPKLVRSIGLMTSSKEYREVGTECRVHTSDAWADVNEPTPQCEQMQTVITTLRDKLNDQMLIVQQLQTRPVTRDVAVMHIVDKVEEPPAPPPPKPEVRDVAINHRTEVDDKELVERQITVIKETYLHEIEQLRSENVRLAACLEEAIVRQTKHVTTRGTNPPEPPVLYSVGTNTKKTSTRDVQVMFTPKSRDVSLCTDRFFHSRDVGLMCTIGLLEQQEQLQELIELKQKYELKVQECLLMQQRDIKCLRDVSIWCDLYSRERRDVCIGVNLEPVIVRRDVNMYCNLDTELREWRDVCIGCTLETRSEQKDACIYVNTVEPIIVERKCEKRDFSMFVQMEDWEKISMAREIASLKMVVPKITRDVGICVDTRTRLMDNLMRNQSSSMESVKTFSRQCNTESKQVRDMATTSAATCADAWITCQMQDDSVRLIEDEKRQLIVTNTEMRSKLKELEQELCEERRKMIVYTTNNSSVDKRSVECGTSQILCVKCTGGGSSSTATTGVNTVAVLSPVTKVVRCDQAIGTDLCSNLNEKIGFVKTVVTKEDNRVVDREVSAFEQNKQLIINPVTHTAQEVVTTRNQITDKRSGEQVCWSTTTMSPTQPLIIPAASLVTSSSSNCHSAGSARNLVTLVKSEATCRTAPVTVPSPRSKSCHAESSARSVTSTLLISPKLVTTQQVPYSTSCTTLAATLSPRHQTSYQTAESLHRSHYQHHQSQQGLNTTTTTTVCPPKPCQPSPLATQQLKVDVNKQCQQQYQTQQQQHSAGQQYYQQVVCQQQQQQQQQKCQYSPVTYSQVTTVLPPVKCVPSPAAAPVIYTQVCPPKPCQPSPSVAYSQVVLQQKCPQPSPTRYVVTEKCVPSPAAYVVPQQKCLPSPSSYVVTQKCQPSPQKCQPSPQKCQQSSTSTSQSSYNQQYQQMHQQLQDQRLSQQQTSSTAQTCVQVVQPPQPTCVQVVQPCVPVVQTTCTTTTTTAPSQTSCTQLLQQQQSSCQQLLQQQEMKYKKLLHQQQQNCQQQLAQMQAQQQQQQQQVITTTTMTSEQSTLCKDSAEFVERRTSEKIEIKKPKGILKSPSLPPANHSPTTQLVSVQTSSSGQQTSSSNSGGGKQISIQLSCSERDSSAPPTFHHHSSSHTTTSSSSAQQAASSSYETSSSHQHHQVVQQQQRKALTFGQNERIHIHSEQSSSECLSYDDTSSQTTTSVLTGVSANPREYLCAQVKYEAPVSTTSPRDQLVLETGTIVDESQLRRLKTAVERPTSTMSSSISDQKINSSATRRENQEEESSESVRYLSSTASSAAKAVNRSSAAAAAVPSSSLAATTTTTTTTTSSSSSAPGHRGLVSHTRHIAAIATASALQTPLNSNPSSNQPKRFELELELHIACAILNDSLYEPLKADKNKVAKALNLIQQDWFKLAAQKSSCPIKVEEHLNAFYSRFSNLLLERIVNMADLNLNTALHYSVSTANFEIVNLLLDTKVCDVNAQNKAGYTSIMLAAVVPITNDYERATLKRLFAEGNVNIKSTDNGQTALMLAVRHGNKDTVSLLLEASSDCNLQDKEGSTALMAACEHGHIDIVRLLLDNSNCDPDIKDNDGETAFDISKKKKRNDIIVLLYAHSSKLRSHHPAIQFSKSRPRIGSAGSGGARK